jgi:hypothetical protein
MFAGDDGASLDGGDKHQQKAASLELLDDPHGELGSYDYMMLAIHQPEILHQRFVISCLQLLVDVTILCLAIHLLRRAVKLVISRPRVVPIRCLIIQCLLGVIFGLVALTSYFPSGAGCATTIWVAGCGVVLSGCLATICILYHVYYVYEADTIVLYVGIPLSTLHTIVCFILGSQSTIFNSNDTGCTVVFIDEFPAVRSLPDILAKFALSVAFILVIYKNYKRYGSKCWTMLLSDGIQYASLVILSNVICAIVIISEFSPLHTQPFLLFDCK